MYVNVCVACMLLAGRFGWFETGFYNGAKKCTSTHKRFEETDAHKVTVREHDDNYMADIYQENDLSNNRVHDVLAALIHITQ